MSCCAGRRDLRPGGVRRRAAARGALMRALSCHWAGFAASTVAFLLRSFSPSTSSPRPCATQQPSSTSPATMSSEYRVQAEPFTVLPEYGSIPIAFQVSHVLDVELVDGGLGGLALHERRLAEPLSKDYDALPGHAPTDWPRHHDLSGWGLFSAFLGEERVGGGVLAHDVETLPALAGRPDRAELFDLRVAPTHRGRGVGSLLFAAALGWARERGCRSLRIETQNVNVPACRFYVAQGCTLASVDRLAYPELAGEVELVWSRET